MWYWEVVWMDPDGKTHSMYAIHGEISPWLANKKLIVIYPRVLKAIKKRGGRVLDAQIVYCSRKAL